MQICEKEKYLYIVIVHFYIMILQTEQNSDFCLILL